MIFRIMERIRSLFQSSRPDWDAYEAQLIEDGWTPDRARADRFEEEFSASVDA